ncbi:MAG: hypothetical protein AAFV19_02375 [Pseudomonadota bacterium]
MSDFKLSRSPISAFRGERFPGIGHNQGPPLDAAVSWRRHVWKKARRELLPRLPLEIIKRRVARAKQLGLEYPQYASILLGTGRDIVAFLFTSDALGVRLARTPVLPGAVADKLISIERCERLLTTEATGNPMLLSREILRAHQIQMTGTATLPERDAASWTEGRDAIQAALRPLKLPADTVVMIGTERHERTWADAAKLARFIPAENYFS